MLSASFFGGDEPYPAETLVNGVAQGALVGAKEGQFTTRLQGQETEAGPRVYAVLDASGSEIARVTLQDVDGKGYAVDTVEVCK